MARIMISIDDELAEKARVAASDAGIRISVVAEDAIRLFVAESNVKTGKIAWPPLRGGKRPLTTKEINDAIEDGRE